MINEDIYENKFSMQAFTDGSALGNSQNSFAGSAVYFPSLKILLSKSFRGTNNHAELTAIEMALEYTLQNSLATSLLIFTDSQYSIKAATGVNRARKNFDLIMRIKELMKKIVVKYEHITAHTKKDDFFSKCNDKVDRKARERANELKRKYEQTIK
jgi:ribonuclease HI